MHAAGHGAGAGDALTSVLARDVGGRVDQRGEGLVEVAAVLGAGHEVGRPRVRSALGAKPVDQVARLGRQGAHAAGGDVQQVALVGGRVGDPAAGVGARVEQDDVEGPAVAGGTVDEVDRGKRPGGAGTDDSDDRAAGSPVAGPGGALTGVPLQSAPHEHLL